MLNLMADVTARDLAPEEGAAFGALLAEIAGAGAAPAFDVHDPEMFQSA
jgi:hypothetical protein